MPRATQKESLNLAYQEKAHRFIPGGAHTYSRADDGYPENAPPILERGEGSWVWDLEGNRFLDYGMALRAVTVGYGYDRIARAAIQQIQFGNNLTRASKIEVDAAERFCSLIPSAEMVKFAKNGSTVTSAAVKLARAFTGRTLVARCFDHPFFSYDDWFIGDTVMNAGVPEAIRSLTRSFRFNAIETLEALFDQEPGCIAAVILEPATSEEPREGFLQRVAELCKKNGTVFILDEMITGFRWAARGAAHHYGVKPDLITFGKGMANGFSVAALAGSREIMSLGGIEGEKERVFLISTTHGAEMCGLAAFLETVAAYEELDVIARLWEGGARLINGINEVARSLGIEKHFNFHGVPCSPYFTTRDAHDKVSLEFRTLFLQEMVNHGVLMPWVAMSFSHSDLQIDQTIDAARKSLVVYRNALEAGVSRFLRGRPIKPVFRRYN
jgi:glutamate-1-semialdehyde 2,1-aminomutase